MPAATVAPAAVEDAGHSSAVASVEKPSSEQTTERDNAVAATSVTATTRFLSSEDDRDDAFLKAVAPELRRLVRISKRMKNHHTQGIYRFSEAVWLRLVRDHGETFGYGTLAEAIKTDGAGRLIVQDAANNDRILELRQNKELSALMAVLFARDNATILAQRLDRDVRPADLYLVHLMGLSGATRYLKALERIPARPADRVFGRVASNHRRLFFKNGTPQTLAQVYATLGKTFARERSEIRDPITIALAHLPRRADAARRQNALEPTALAGVAADIAEAATTVETSIGGEIEVVAARTLLPATPGAVDVALSDHDLHGEARETVAIAAATPGEAVGAAPDSAPGAAGGRPSSPGERRLIVPLPTLTDIIALAEEKAGVADVGEPQLPVQADAWMEHLRSAAVELRDAAAQRAREALADEATRAPAAATQPVARIAALQITGDLLPELRVKTVKRPGALPPANKIRVVNLGSETFARHDVEASDIPVRGEAIGLSLSRLTDRLRPGRWMAALPRPHRHVKRPHAQRAAVRAATRAPSPELALGNVTSAAQAAVSGETPSLDLSDFQTPVTAQAAQQGKAVALSRVAYVPPLIAPSGFLSDSAREAATERWLSDPAADERVPRAGTDTGYGTRRAAARVDGTGAATGAVRQDGKGNAVQAKPLRTASRGAPTTARPLRLEPELEGDKNPRARSWTWMLFGW